MSKTVYIKTELSAKVHKKHVILGDIAKIYCPDKNIQNRLRSLHIYTFQNNSDKRIIMSSLKLVETVCNSLDSASVIHIGEPDFLVQYEPVKKHSSFLPLITAVLCSVLIFFGSAFAIMTFNTDVSVNSIFNYIYEKVTGIEHVSVSSLEISYSAGLGIGIIIFYNHFGKKKLSCDPTPIEIEVKKYETEIETALVDGVEGKEGFVDVP